MIDPNCSLRVSHRRQTKLDRQSSVGGKGRRTGGWRALVFALLMAPCFVFAAENPAPPASLAAAQAEVDTVAKLMVGLQQSLSREQVDRDALLDARDYEFEALFAFVRDEIRYEPYVGVLRGAEGTLVSRAGNDLDQALLLATLLQDAGGDARIVRGRLSFAAATALLDQLLEPLADDEFAVEDPARWASLNAELAALNPDDGTQTLPPMEEARFYKRVQRASEMLETQLAVAGISLAPGTIEPLIEATQDYFWVEMRDSASGPWTALHPAFRSAEAPQTAPDVLQTFGDSLPESLQHRLRVAVFIEQRIGERRTTTQVAGPWERPVANLHGRVLSFYNQPNSLTDPSDGSELRDALAQASLFVPMLHGQPGTAFDLRGQTVDIDTLSMDKFGASAVIQTVGGKGADAASALAGLGSSDPDNTKPIMQLTAQWMEFTLIAQSGEERTFRRDLMQERVAESGEDAMRQVLAVRHDYLAASGRFSETYAAERLYGHFAQVAPAWQQLNQVLSGASDAIDKPAELEPSVLPFIALIRSFDTGAKVIAGGRSYRPSPTLIVLHSRSLGRGRAFRGVDIVTHEQRVFTRDRPLRLDPLATLRRGVWETAMETLLFPSWSPEERKTNTFSVFEAAKAQGISHRLVRTPGDLPPGALSDPRAAGLLKAELEAGRVVLLPDRPPEGLLMSGWWRVDPQSGQTLGLLEDGRGSELAEYLVSNLEMAVGLIMAIGKYAECDQYANADDPRLQACCLIEAHLGNVGGNALGGVIAASFGSAAGGLCETGGIALGQLQKIRDKDEPFRCKIFDDPDSMIGAGGVVNTDYMGCGALQNIPTLFD